jgi:hypothetical protein
MTKQDLMKLLSPLFAANLAGLPKDIQGFLDVAHPVIGDLHPTAIKNAVGDIIRDSIYFPRVAEILKAAQKHKPKLSGGVVSNTLPAKLQDYAQRVRRFETIRPEEWTPADRAEFEALHNRPVQWQTEPIDAPWMWWKSK